MCDMGEIVINQHSYKIGFLGKAKQLALVEDINELLVGETPAKKS